MDCRDLSLRLGVAGNWEAGPGGCPIQPVALFPGRRRNAYGAPVVHSARTSIRKGARASNRRTQVRSPEIFHVGRENCTCDRQALAPAARIRLHAAALHLLLPQPLRYGEQSSPESPMALRARMGPSGSDADDRRRAPGCGVTSEGRAGFCPKPLGREKPGTPAKPPSTRANRDESPGCLAQR